MVIMVIMLMVTVIRVAEEWVSVLVKWIHRLEATECEVYWYIRHGDPHDYYFLYYKPEQETERQW